ncbi:MAG TPA: hypothetical protein VGO47_05985 [Chlamydiales bacterium]|nr:hypothetical protein [Chlamydiales bacterium]
MLNPQDVPPSVLLPPIGTVHQAYPHGKRYTLQWLVPDSNVLVQERNEQQIPNNRDAAFVENVLNSNTHESLPLPSGLLLHYNYGAAVLKHWGRNKSFLDLSSIPRPPQPVEPVSRLSKASYHRTVVDRKLEAARSGKEPGGSDGRNANEGNTDRRELDEDEIVMLLWLNNNPEALQEFQEEERLAKESITDWRAGVE